MVEPSKPEEEKVQHKHAELAKQEEDKTEEVAITNEKETGIKNKITSVFLKMTKNWNDKDFVDIPEDMQKGIVEGLTFLNPSKIQSVAIPLIATPTEEGTYENVIA